MIRSGRTYRDCLGSFVRETLCVSERVVAQSCVQSTRRERISRARHQALSPRLSKVTMLQASRINSSLVEGCQEADHLVELDRLRVVFVSTEVAPWSKVGGLADVVGALPKALAGLPLESWQMACNVLHEEDDIGEKKKRISIGTSCIWSVSPMYEEYDGLVDCGVAVPIPDYDISYDDTVDMDTATLHECMDGGVRRVFVKHPLLDMNRVKPPVASEHPSFTYLDTDGGVYDCHNMDARYDTLAWGALAAAAMLPDDNSDEMSRRRNIVFVLNDWPTALHVLRLKQLIDSKRNESMYTNLSAWEKSIVDSLGVVKSVFCIHNLAYQGVFPMEAVRHRLHLSPDLLLPMCTHVPWEAHVLGGRDDVTLNDVSLNDDDNAHHTVNFMRAALLLSDQIVTVSPHYAEEIMSENEELNCGMGDMLHRRKVLGIMNGIDIHEWDPLSDEHTPDDAKYGVISAPRGKSMMKKYLQSRIGLDEDEDAILIVFIGRLTEQKGIDVLLRSIQRILPPKPAPKPCHASDEEETVDSSSTMFGCGRRVQVAVLGTGDQWMENAVESLEYSFPGNAKGICSFSEELAHWMLAAADFAIIPSKFEPCGLIAQCAARYGAVPIMTATGGLKNLGDDGIGILVEQGNDTKQNVDKLVHGIEEAAMLYDSEGYRSKQIACMEHDFSWGKSAQYWQHVIARLLCT